MCSKSMTCNSILRDNHARDKKQVAQFLEFKVTNVDNTKTIRFLRCCN